MFCSLTKEEAAAMNAISDQAFAVLNNAMNAATMLTQITKLSGCHRSSALLHAALNIAVLAALGHRKTHDQMDDINSLGDLKKNPEAFVNLVEDINEIFASVCRGIDPGHDYLLNLFKTENASKSADGPGKGGEPEKKG